jgi:putative membrane protein
MNKYLVAAAVTALTLGAAQAQTQDRMAPQAGGQMGTTQSQMSNGDKMAAGPDHVFVMKAANSNMFEIESSKVALQMAKNAEVKQFAQQMIADHEMAAKNMMAVAPDAPKQMDAAHMAMVEKLRATDAAAFDEAYIDAQVKAHDEAVALFTKYEDDAKDPALKQFAAKTLPVLKQHQDHVKKLDAKM